MHRFAFVLVIALAACSKPTPSAGGEYLTVEKYCGSFCAKLCGTCSDQACINACKPRCYNGRAASMVMDGKDPKVALARTQADLDGCLATVTPASCMQIMAGQVPPACYTIQH